MHCLSRRSQLGCPNTPYRASLQRQQEQTEAVGFTVGNPCARAEQPEAHNKDEHAHKPGLHLLNQQFVQYSLQADSAK